MVSSPVACSAPGGSAPSDLPCRPRRVDRIGNHEGAVVLPDIAGDPRRLGGGNRLVVELQENPRFKGHGKRFIERRNALVRLLPVRTDERIGP